MADIYEKYDVDLPTVQRFTDYGEYQNNKDEYGNYQLIFSTTQDDSAKTHYIDYTLKQFRLSDEKIKDNNHVEFSELESDQITENRSIDELLNKYNQLLAENEDLQKTIDTLINQYENDSDEQVIESMKREIINLRIKLKQGKVFNDFDDIFPFLPKT